MEVTAVVMEAQARPVTVKHIRGIITMIRIGILHTYWHTPYIDIVTLVTVAFYKVFHCYGFIC